MATCCPNCSSSTAIGTDLASACTECVSVSVAGGSMSMTMLVGIAACTIAAVYVGRSIGRLLGGRVMLKGMA